MENHVDKTELKPIETLALMGHSLRFGQIGQVAANLQGWFSVLQIVDTF